MKKLYIISLLAAFSFTAQALHVDTPTTIKTAALCGDCDGSCKPKPGELL